MTVAVAVLEKCEVFGDKLARSIETTEGFKFLGRYRDTESAIHGIGHGKPDVLLADSQLLRDSGFQRITDFKNATPKTQIVLLSARLDEDQVLEALWAGAIGHLSKDTPTAVLLNLISDVHQGGSIVSSSVARKLVQHYQTQKEHTSPDTPQSSVCLPTHEQDGAQHDQILSAREQEILGLLTEGLLHKEIAQRYTCSIHTIREHLRRIYTKLNVSTSREAVAKHLRQISATIVKL